MTYLTYVLGAYAVFVIVLLWDFIIPRLQIRQQLRAARHRKVRTARPPATLELKR